ncbi:alpha/beta fold hydrolase [Serratia fonticola]|jgi:pimeloyl-ACP methyl ester carboxylesterase|uniref:alpha/beta fold hydrolase n=1 Tax=Serratia fonticola TaxID=47917 RepID=UPI0003A67BE6
MTMLTHGPLSNGLEAEHIYIKINGHRIHCAIAGSGQPVLLIPGWPQTWYTWRYVMQALANAGFQAIAVDPPGIGDSDKPLGGYDTGSVAEKLHQVMAQLGHQRYAVIGHDIGMWLGYALASDYPHAVSRLVLTEAVIPGLAEAPPIFVPAEDNIFLWHFMFNQLTDLPEALTTGREAEYLGYIFHRWSYRRDRVAAETYIAAYSVPGSLRAGFDYYRAIPETIRQNQQRAKTPLTMPVMTIGAEHATRDAPFLTLQGKARQLQGEVVPGCGHFITEECHEEFVALILPFLQEGKAHAVG